MTDGPEAEVGEIIDVSFPRPRERKAVMEHPDYYVLRERLIEFLEIHAHKKRTHPAPPPNPVPPTGSMPKSPTIDLNQVHALPKNETVTV